MATIRLLPSLTPSLKTAPLPSFPLHPLVRLQCPKFSSLFEPSHPREIALVSSSEWLGKQNKSRRVFALLAVVNEESLVAEEIDTEEREFKRQQSPCELYVCNLPRSCDIAELVEMFKPYGTVISVEVSKNPQTGISRGCGFVTMGSVNSAKNAIAGLDGSDFGDRELRVKFSVDMSSTRRNPETLNSAPIKTLFYESPFKVYIGNLAWNVKPEEIRNQFSKFGNVVSARVLYDRKAGKNRCYAFLSFSSAKERDAALSLNGKDFRGRELVVREGVEREGVERED